MLSARVAAVSVVVLLAWNGLVARQPPSPSAYVLGRGAVGAASLVDGLAGFRLDAERRVHTSLPSGASRITLDFVIPDGFLETLAFSTPLVGQRFVPGNIYRGFRSDRLFARAEEPNNTRFGPMSREQEAAALRQRRRLATELLASLLLTTHTPVPVEYTLAGRAQAARQTADVLEVSCPDGYRFQLFLDSETHRVVMMVPGPGGGTTPRSNPAEPQRWFFADHRRTGEGLWLPYTIVHEVKGVTTEEWLVQTYAINPPVPRDLRR